MKTKRRKGLTQEEWRAVSCMMKRVTNLMVDLDSLLNETLTVAEMQPYRKAFGKVQSLRARLDALRSNQHPSWLEGDRLFYGCQWTYHAGWR